MPKGDWGIKMVGAAYCVYDACDLMEESVERLYSVVDKVLFLVNFKPWCGDPIEGAFDRTLKLIMSIDDPDNKIEIVAKFWADEKDQRNTGLEILRSQNMDWCMIVDDDEFYDTLELKTVVDSLEEAQHDVYLTCQQIYWKDRYTIIEDAHIALPAFVRTDGSVHFSENRIALVASGRTWFTFARDSILCHHLSYVRSDGDMYKKVTSFSHANEIKKDWFERVWVHWYGGMENLHPTNPPSFKRAVPAKYFLD